MEREAKPNNPDALIGVDDLLEEAGESQEKK
jgi:hypothetical protein